MTGAGPRPVTVGTAAVQVTEESASEPGAAPATWRAETQAWYAAIVADWEFSPAGLQLLQHAAACLDLEVACRERVAQDGLMVPGVGGGKAHPLLTTAAQARGQFLTAMCQLGLSE